MNTFCKPSAALVLLSLAASVAWAQTAPAAPAAPATPSPSGDNCEVLRTQIEARIRSAGVANVSLVVLDNAAVTTGRVLGTCGTGTRKIVQMGVTGVSGAPATATAAAAASNAAANPAAKAAPRAATRTDDDLLTECKDGSMSVGGTCKKP